MRRRQKVPAWPRTAFRPHRRRRRAGRLCRGDPRRAARHEDGAWSSASIWAASASTGAASRPRRCCARPRSTTCCTISTSSASRPTTSRFDLAKIVKRSRKVAGQLVERRQAPAEEEQGHGVRRPRQARRQGQDRGRRRTASRSPTSPAKHIILATGARARSLPGLEPDGKLVWTYKEAMVPEAMPKSLLVVGSGAIGIEFASFYRNLGAEVTVVEVLDRVLPVEDEEISAFARKAFEKQGMKIITGATVKALKKGGDSVTATVEAGGKTQRDHRRPGDPGGRHRRQCREHRPRRHQGEGREDPHRRRRMAARPASPASMPSATSSARPGWRTRRATRA